MKMYVVNACASLIIIGLCCGLTVHSKDYDMRYLLSSGTSSGDCRTVADACNTIDHLLKIYFQQISVAKGALHILTNISFSISQDMQKNYSKLTDWDVEISSFGHTARDTEVTLDGLYLQGTWRFINVNLTVTTTVFPLGNFTMHSTESTSNHFHVYVERSLIGFIVCTDVAEVTIDNCFIDGEERRHGRALEFIRSVATIRDTTVTDNNSPDSLIVINDHSHVMFYNSNFTNNEVATGNVFVNNYSVVVMTQCIFTGNSAVDSGSCIAVLLFSQLYIYNSTFIENTANYDGGAIFSKFNTHIEIDNNSFFDKNKVYKSTSSGGAISVFNSTVLVLRNTVLSNNYAAYQGGAVSANEGSTVIMSDANFIQNSAIDSCGAIRCFEGCTIQANRCTFKSNIANDGGGIEAYGHILNFTSCTFDNNTSSVTDTGALTVVQFTTLRVLNSTFTNNKAGRYGGAIQAYGNVKLYIEYTNFTNNSARVGAGAIYGESNIWITMIGCRFVNNAAVRAGGAMIGGQTVWLTVTDSFFINNAAISGPGGALDGFNSTIIRNTVFMHNIAATQGGAIAKPDVLSIENSTFTNNTAVQSGGAISCSLCHLSSHMSNYTGNKAEGDGGAIQVLTQSFVNIAGGMLLDNVAVYGNGGGIFLADRTNGTITGTYFDGNSGYYGGGGLYVFGTKITNVEVVMEDAVFANNLAKFMGGGLFLGPWVKMKAWDCDFVNNTADTYGGAIKTEESIDFCCTECHFVNNKAIMQGGAIYTKQEQNKNDRITKIHLANGTVIDNESIKGRDIYIFATNRVPVPKIHTYNMTVGNSTNPLHSHDPDFPKNAAKLNYILSEPDHTLDVAETPFASLSPQICFDGCMCHYDQSYMANNFDCSSHDLKALPANVQKGTDWLTLMKNNLTSLCGYKVYLDSVRALDVRSSNLNSICADFLGDWFTKIRIEYLDLRHNQLKELPKLISEISMTELYIGNNPYRCDCDMLWMKEWMATEANDTNYIRDYKNATCANGKFKGRAIWTLDGGQMGCNFNLYEILIPVILSVLIIPTTLILMNRYVDVIRFQIYLKFDVLLGKDFDADDLENSEMDFDLFVSHSHKDQLWFIRNVMPFLERDHSYSICIPERDWDASASIRDNIVTAIECSRRMVIVLSKNYLQSDWCMEEFQMATTRMKEGRAKFIIVIMLEDVTTEDLDPTLKLYIKTYNYIKVTSDMELLRKRVVFSLPRKTLREHLGRAADEVDGEVQGLLGDKIRSRMAQRYLQRELNLQEGRAHSDVEFGNSFSERSGSFGNVSVQNSGTPESGVPNERTPLLL